MLHFPISDDSILFFAFDCESLTYHKVILSDNHCHCTAIPGVHLVGGRVPRQCKQHSSRRTNKVGEFGKETIQIQTESFI